MPAILSLLQCYIFIKKGSHHTTSIIMPMNHTTTENQWSKLHMHIQTSHFSRESLCNVTTLLIYIHPTLMNHYSWHQLDSQLSANFRMHPNYHIEAEIKWPSVCLGHHKGFFFFFFGGGVGCVCVCVCVCQNCCILIEIYIGICSQFVQMTKSHFDHGELS